MYSLDDSRQSLEASSGADDEAAHKAQKTQRKRSLKNEYEVALRVAVEEEMKKVCYRDALSASDELRSECERLVDQESETLPRAILDGDDGFCANFVGGGACADSAARDAAKAVYVSSKVRSREGREKHEKRKRDASRRRAKSKERDAQPAPRIRLSQECELCGLFFSQMASTLDETRASLALSEEAALRRQQQIEGVQKAQTRRWLKMEYGQNLAAALEDKINGICTSDELVGIACSDDSEGPRWQGTPFLRQPDDRPFERAACAVRVQARCGALVDQADEALQRSALDGHDSRACAWILPSCTVERAMTYNTTHWANAEAGEGVEHVHVDVVKDEV